MRGIVGFVIHKRIPPFHNSNNPVNILGKIKNEFRIDIAEPGTARYTTSVKESIWTVYPYRILAEFHSSANSNGVFLFDEKCQTNL